jgi:hypothetical protein
MGAGSISRRMTVWMLMSVLVMSAFGVASKAAAQGDTVLAAADAGKVLPEKVFFRGQSATTQLRNSGGVKFADGMMVLVTLVDTGGYSSALQERYQAYLVAEVPIRIEGHSLPAGVYGVGFLAGDKFLVMDVGAHELFTVGSHKDADMKRPMPLKVEAAAGGFRLYAGRSYVGFSK